MSTTYDMPGLALGARVTHPECLALDALTGGGGASRDVPELSTSNEEQTTSKRIAS